MLRLLIIPMKYTQAAEVKFVWKDKTYNEWKTIISRWFNKRKIKITGLISVAFDGDHFLLGPTFLICKMRGLNQAIVRFLWILMCMIYPPFIPAIHTFLHLCVDAWDIWILSQQMFFESLQIHGIILAMVVYAKNYFPQIVSSLVEVYSICTEIITW